MTASAAAASPVSRSCHGASGRGLTCLRSTGRTRPRTPLSREPTQKVRADVVGPERHCRRLRRSHPTSSAFLESVVGGDDPCWVPATLKVRPV